MTPRALVALLLVGIAAAWGALTFSPLAAFRYGDWDQYLTFFEIQRRALVDWRELPLWNPWLLGGIPGLAHPQFDALSPFFLPVLAFGTVPGAAIFFTLHALAGMAGAYALARALGHARVPSLLAGIVFLFVFAPFVQGGVVNRVNGSLVPWVVLGWLRARRAEGGARGLALLAASVALLVLEGGFYALVGALLLAGLLALCEGSLRTSARSLALLAGGTLLGLALAAVRLLPTAELYVRFPRASELYASSPLLDLHRLATLPAALAALLAAPSAGERPLLFGQPIFVSVDLGLPLLALLLFALARITRRVLLATLTLLLSLLVLGNAAPLNLWAALNRLPGLSALNLPMSLLFALFVPLALLLANALAALARGLFASERARDVASVAFVALGALLPLALQCREILAPVKRVELAPTSSASAPFVQTRGDHDAMLPSIRRNEGVVDAYEEVVRSRLKVAAVPRESPDYRGEWILERGGAALAPARFAPSTLEFDWDGRAADRLLVNQNALPGWSATLDGRPLPVESAQSRIAIPLPAQAGALRLAYRPRSLLGGALVSAAALLMGLALFTGLGRRLHGALALAPEDLRLEARLGPEPTR